MLTDEQLLFGEPIQIEGIGNLIQPTVKEIARIGSKNYFDNLLLPFIITSESLTGKYKGMDIYDFFFFEQNVPLLQQLIICLNIFFKQDIGYDMQGDAFRFKVGKDGIVCKENFKKLQEIIRKINCIKLPEPEKLPENMTPEKLRIHKKMKFHRNRKAKMDEPTFKEIINTVMHCGESFVPYNVVGNFTYYQLVNSYQVIVGLSNFNEYMGYKLSLKYELKEDMPSWQEIIKMI